MTVVTQTLGWVPEQTEATMLATAAVSKGDLVRLTTNYYGTTGNGAAIPGVTKAGVVNTANLANKWGVFGVCLADAAANKQVRVCIRGRAWVSVEIDATAIAANVELVAGGDETTSTHSLMAAADLNAGVTVSPTSRKILAISEEAGDAATGTEDHIWVIFNGAEGFGTYVGDTVA